MQGIKLIFIGHTDSKEIRSLMKEYEKRLSRYIRIEVEELPDVKTHKKISEEEQKRLEAEAIFSAVGVRDDVILLDEHGKMPGSVELARFIEGKSHTVAKKLIFIVGGPYGFSQEVHDRFPQKLSLSKLTFSHQMVRLFLIEQIYRSFTILHNHPYHHE